MSNLTELLTEFFTILDEVEESDSGTEFHPVFISSCRALKTIRINELFYDIKQIIECDKEVNNEP